MTTPLSHLSARELARIDAICLEFEERLRRGEAADIESLVQSHGGPQRNELRTELQAIASEIAAELSNRGQGLTVVGDAGLLAGTDGRQPTPWSAASGIASRTAWLPAGSMLGPYRIQRLIGRGGMGEVYQGCDERLGRDVAIKILVEDWAGHPDRLERFGRETRAIATLSHPNIVSLYDVGEYRRRPYAVMELLVGVTLRDALRTTPKLEPAEVRRIGVAAADAMAVAHAAGIIHRDLKPENLFLTHDGVVKLLDFGLSRTHTDSGGSSGATATGVILGTMGYLSPEQANGMHITPVADLFSLGCVLHECFYGVRPFAGETVAESLASIINGEPAGDPDVASSDQDLAETIRRCLRKDPAERFSSAAELAAALRAADGAPETATSLAGPPLAGLPLAGHGALMSSVTSPDGSARSTSIPHNTAAPRGLIAGSTATSLTTEFTAGLGVPARLPGPVTPRGFSRRTLLGRVGLGALVVGGLGGTAGLVHWLRTQPTIRSVAVLPLEDGGPDGGPATGRRAMATRELGKGEQLAAAIADQLTRIPDLRVVPFLPLRDNGLGSPIMTGLEDTLSAAESLSRVAEHLGVDAILVGSVSSDAEGFQTIDVRLIHGSTGYQIGTYRTRVEEKTNLIEQMKTAQKVAAGIGRELDGYHSGVARANDSYHCFLNGHSRMDTESVGSLRDAIHCFQNAIEQDEKFPEAHAGLALTALLLASHVELGERTRLIEIARDAVKSAIRLEPDSATARLAMAMLAWQVDWEFRSAAHTFAVYVPRMPDNWVAQHEYALFLAARRDFTGAQRFASRAVGLDPTSAAFRLDAARIRWYAGVEGIALREARAVAAVAKGTARDAAVGTILDMLEQRNRVSEAASLLSANGIEATAATYWNVRARSLQKVPYGPYGATLNEFICDVRRGVKITDERLVQIREYRSPRLPLVFSAHPALVEFRGHTGMHDVIVDSPYRS